MKYLYYISFLVLIGCLSTRKIESQNLTQEHKLEELGISIDLPENWVIERNYHVSKYDFTAYGPLVENEEFNSIYLTYDFISSKDFSDEYKKLIQTITEKHKMIIESEGDCKLGKYNGKRILARSSENTNLTYIISDLVSDKKYFIVATSTFENAESELLKLDKIIKSIKVSPIQTISEGQELYLQNCASCHGLKMNQNLTGPALGGLKIRREKEWIKSFINNSQLMYEKGDSTAVHIIDRYGGQQVRCGSGKPRNFNNKEIEAILSFIEYESSK